MSAKTIEDYKRDVVKLKGMINKLTTKQQELQKKHETLASQLEASGRQNEVDQVVNLIYNAIKIQKVWRGFKVRTNFFKIIEDLSNQNKKNDAIKEKDSSSFSNKKAVQRINKELQKITGIDLAMLFRALDEELSHSIKVEKLENYLKQHVLSLKKVRESDLKRLLFLLDEGCTGYISQQEMHTCLSAYDIIFDDSQGYSRTIELEVLLNFAYRCSLKGFTAEDTLQIVNTNHSPYVESKDLKLFCNKNLAFNISQKEIDVLFSSFDVQQDGQVTQKQFIKILSKAIESSKEQNKSASKSDKK